MLVAKKTAGAAAGTSRQKTVDSDNSSSDFDFGLTKAKKTTAKAATKSKGTKPKAVKAPKKVSSDGDMSDEDYGRKKKTSPAVVW